MNTALLQLARKLRSELGKQGLSTRRACSVSDIFLCIRKTAEAKRRVRIYSDYGFVPSSYKYRCFIQYVEAVKSDDGWTVTTGWTGAQRARGNGSLVVVQ